MSNTTRIVRAALATLALGLVLVGVPILLVLAVGWPLPRGVPVWSDITSTISGTTPLDNHVVWKTLSVVAWVAWGQIALGALIELDSARRGQLAPALRGLGFGQGAAGYLIGVISLALPGGIASTNPAPTPHDARLLSAPISYVTPDRAPATPTHLAERVATPTAIDHVVQPKENLWVIARRYLPPGAPKDDIAAAVRRIFDANTGRPQPNGRTLTNGSEIQPGWTLRIDAPAVVPAEPITEGTPRQVVVAPGDTLSGIAKAHLGDADAFHELFDLNHGKPQPDGRSLQDENLLRPGWVLDIPTVDPTNPTAPTVSAPATLRAPDTAVPDDPAPTQDSAADAPRSTRDVHTNGNAARVENPAENPTDDDSGPVAEPADDEHGVPAPFGLLGAGLSTAGVVALLDRRRRAQQRRRRSGRHIVVPTPTLQRAERALRAGAATDPAVLLDAALRAASNGSTALPSIHWAEATHTQVTLQLIEPAPAPTGFTAIAPDRWKTTASVDELSDLGATAVAPTPTLVPIGITPDGTEVLVDLETIPVTTISGPPELVAEQLRSIVVSLTTSLWSDDTTVTVVGLDPEFTAVPTTRGATLSEALDAAETRAGEAARVLASVGLTSTVTARTAGLIPDAWAPHVVVSADTPTDADSLRLADLARSPHYAVAIVCPHVDESDQATITVDETGQLTLADCPLTITARRLDAADGLVITDLLETASTGEDITEPDLAEPMVGMAPEADIVLIASSAEPPSVTSASLMAELDVLVKVIGEVEAVRLSADDQTLRPEKQKALEAVAYLAARDSAVPLEDVQAALWPSGANSTKTFRNAITSARSMLGEDRDGRPLLPIPESGRYDLSNRVATDYELVHELIHHADLLDDSQVQLVTTLLTDALSLVRGEPYVGAGRNYAWVAQHRGIIVAEVVNAAEELAEISLELGDWRAAEWAARQGLRAFPCDERLYRVLMRAAHASGSISGVHRVFDELCHVVADPDHGAEPEDTVHPETVSLLEALTASSTPDRATA